MVCEDPTAGISVNSEQLREVAALLTDRGLHISTRGIHLVRAQKLENDHRRAVSF